MNIMLFMNLGGMEILMLFLVAGLPFLLTVYCLIDIIRSTFRDPINKVVWVIVTILVPVLGALLYLIFGRGQKTPLET